MLSDGTYKQLKHFHVLEVNIYFSTLFTDAQLHSKTMNHFTFSETVLAPRLSISSLNIEILGGCCLISCLPAGFSLVEETGMWTTLETSGRRDKRQPTCRAGEGPSRSKSWGDTVQGDKDSSYLGIKKIQDSCFLQKVTVL